MPESVVAIVGATATGKSSLALAIAEAVGGEIVNADPQQFYRGMDIGTAKVPVSERRGIFHHQIDTLGIREEASVARYQKGARADLESIRARGSAVVVVGGSGLYIRALLDRLDIPPTDPGVRAAIEARVDEEGPGVLHRELMAVDPEAAARIPAQNARRIIRALEVIAITGGPYSATLPRREYVLPTVQIGLRTDRDVLDRRIEERTRRMWDGGLLEETEELVRVGLREGRTARRAVGYAEALRCLDGEITRDEGVTLTAQRTRRLARRQDRWFNPDERVRWIGGAASPGHEAGVVREALRLLGRVEP
ncbi:MAG: tRNA (adenosine(37)-N6)-dimethylallyltransferase MiaA [Demequinaceae bacterium]|nr:tRNA (adenosine(37)-N6)-dimethylallyltransferase MiaA [Demequinaceae bacterium]